MKNFPAILVFTLLPLALYAQSAETIQKELNVHAERLRPWTADPVLQSAVKAQNARAVPLAEIQRLDQAWAAKQNEALVQKTITGACADRLRELAAKAGYGEAFVSDNQGALVCATARTSDYWQGDEAKWINAFGKGKGATFIDRPRLDDSARARLAQISVPLMDGQRAIGVLTVGVSMGALTKP